MRKIFFCLIAALFSFGKTNACADFDPDYEYYNLFMQDIINDPQYYPFLLTYGTGYYSDPDTGKNENIEEWQDYLGLSYANTEYLVFKTTRADIQNLIAGKAISDSKLRFVDASFVVKHKQALLYLAYAKYLEPYMSITSSDPDNSWYYRPEDYKTADQLDYDKVISVLTKSWKAETDKELKLRYGYQLVRFAHYNRNYSDAIDYFDTYVESLNFKSAIYYYALDQKAGAQRGLGDETEANYNFFKVFTNSKNLKTGALSSIKFTENVDFKKFLDKAKTANEINDVYLLLGYMSFSNPIAAVEKITAKTPDAIQAKVLMARAVNSLERTYVKSDFYCWEGDCFEKATDKRYPIVRDKDISDVDVFFKQTLAISLKLANQASTKDKNFWNLTSAYLCFLNKDYSAAKQYLAKVETSNPKYLSQKRNLAMYIDISEQPKITNDIEISFYTKYKDVLNQKYDGSIYYYDSINIATYSTYGFVIDVLANRYFLQGDYAKSFLLSHDIMTLENYPRLDLLADIEKLYQKTSKNVMEQYISGRIYPDAAYSKSKLTAKQFDVQSYIEDMRGNIYLAQGNLEKALEYFNKVKPGYISYISTWEGYQEVDDQNHYHGFNNVSADVFGYNKIECFNCTEDYVMGSDYLSEFKYIKPRMNKKELVEALIRLQKASKENNVLSAKANYLLGNFYYNMTSNGYYRHILRFDQTNGNGEKYHSGEKEPADIYSGIYFKNYPIYSKDDISYPQTYFDRAYSLATDNELKARIAFALSKCEQATYYAENGMTGYYYWSDDLKDDGILIRNRKYFKELQKYKDTRFYDEVKTNCLYFAYYVNNFGD